MKTRKRMLLGTITIIVVILYSCGKEKTKIEIKPIDSTLTLVQSGIEEQCLIYWQTNRNPGYIIKTFMDGRVVVGDSSSNAIKEIFKELVKCQKNLETSTLFIQNQHSCDFNQKLNDSLLNEVVKTNHWTVSNCK